MWYTYDMEKNDMVLNLDHASSMVRFIVALLDDPHGITEKAFDLILLAVDTYTVENVHKSRILDKVKKCEGRVFLPKGWNDDESSG